MGIKNRLTIVCNEPSTMNAALDECYFKTDFVIAKRTLRSVKTLNEWGLTNAHRRCKIGTNLQSMRTHACACRSCRTCARMHAQSTAHACFACRTCGRVRAQNISTQNMRARMRTHARRTLHTYADAERAQPRTENARACAGRTCERVPA